MSSRCRSLACALAMATFGCASLAAARAGDAGDRAAPQFTVAQAADGKALYAAKCAACHGAHLEGVSGPPLRATPDDPRTIADTYAIASRMMPKNDPRSLPAAAYLAITAYLMSENGCASGASELTASAATATAAQLTCAAASVAGH